MYLHIHVYTFTYIHTHISVYTYTHILTHIYVYMYVCNVMYVCIYIYKMQRAAAPCRRPQPEVPPGFSDIP